MERTDQRLRNFVAFLLGLAAYVVVMFIGRGFCFSPTFGEANLVIVALVAANLVRWLLWS